MAKKKVREVRLKAFALNVKPADIARQRGITPQAVSQAIKGTRQIFLTVDEDNLIQRVTEYRDPVEIWEIE